LHKTDQNVLMTVKAFIMLQNSNKCCYFKLSIHQKILSSTAVFNNDNSFMNHDN